MQFRKFAFERREKIGEILEGKFAVESADDVQLSGSFVNGGACDLYCLLDRMCIRVFSPSATVKSAKLAVCNADICVVEMTIDVVISSQPVLLSPNKIGQLTQSIQVVRF